MTNVGVLIIHGIFGSPREFDYLASRLQNLGYQTRQVTLPGHGKSPIEALKEITEEKLRSHCMAEYEALAATCDEVIIIGHSLGGICTLLTASENPEKLKGIMTFSTPCEKAYFINYPQGLRHLSRKHWLHGLRYLHQSYTSFEKPDFKPWWVSHLRNQTQNTFQSLETALPQINVPVCLTHSEFDMAIPFAEMHKLKERLVNAESIDTHHLNKSGHQIFAYSRDKKKATGIVIEFIQSTCSAPVNPVDFNEPARFSARKLLALAF